MIIKYNYIEDLPALAWTSVIKNGICKVYHGKYVECSDWFWVEGAWDGSYKKGDFDKAEWFCGTGGHLYSDRVIFSTPTHVTYGLYYFCNNNVHYVSNSLYFLMALTGRKMDSQYLDYEVDFNSVLDGVELYRNKVRVLDESEKVDFVEIEYFRNIIIDDNNQVRIEKKPLVNPFCDFNDYYMRLYETMSKLIRNSQDTDRKRIYGLITTISKGYDAPCCAAIAKKVGCDTALTFKAEGKYKDDSGVEVARYLGYKNIIEKDALLYKTRNDLVEAEYVCTGELGAQISFCTFDDEYRGNVVLTGDRGDSIWGKDNKNRNNDFCFIDILSHLGNAERRLWIGYISVPMPLFGASSWESIYDISNSQEMKPWCMNNNYDRPIPRRICEEAGVPREAFGISKHGAGFVYRYDWMSRIKERMSDSSAKKFEEYVRLNKKVHLIQVIRYFWKTKSVYLNRIGMKTSSLSLKQLSEISNPMAARYLVPWAGTHMIKKYANILIKPANKKSRLN